MSDKSFSEQAAFLMTDALDLIKQVLVKHSAAVLEEMRDQIVKRNERISELERQLAEAVKRLKLQHDEAVRLHAERKASTEGVPHLFTAGWDAGFQEALTPDNKPDQDRCTETYLQMVGSGMIQP